MATDLHDTTIFTDNTTYPLKKMGTVVYPDHGTPAQVCRSCSALLDHLGIDVISS